MKTKILFLMAVCMLVVTSAFAQTRTIKGRVVSDTDGEPLIGATIQEKGAKGNGVVTDINGNFTIKVPENATLVVSYIGYTQQQVKPKGNNMSITLKEDQALLDDIVVIGYGVQKKSDLTGAVTKVKGEEISNLSTTDAAAAIQGKAAGVQVISSGAPGAGAQIRVRGFGSNSTTESDLNPLYIVDGAQVDNIQYLDPTLIESMEVLKDGASAAIYGARAGNGVVLITTKDGSGQKGKTSVTYGLKATCQSLGHKADLFNASDYIAYHNYIGDITQEDLTRNGYNGQDTDWYDEVFGTSWAIQHNLTVSGSNEKGNFLAGLGYVKNDGTVKGDKDMYKRFNVQLNASYRFNKWLKISTNNNVEKWSTSSVGNGYQSFLNSVTSIDPLTPAYVYSQEDMGMNMKNQWNSDANHGNVMVPSNYTDANPVWYGTSKYIEDATGNPLAMRDRINATNEGINLRGSTALDINPIKELTFTSRLGYRIIQQNIHDRSNPFWLSSMAYSNNYSISAETDASHYYQWENFINYNKTFAEKHNLGVMVGMSFEKTHTDNTIVSSSDTQAILEGDGASNFNYINCLNANGKSHLSATNLPGDATTLSYYGRISYNYDNRYYIQANLRRDAFDSSRLSEANRWGTFPSVSAGWTVSNEQFFRDAIDEETFSFLKIRGSWGRNGNVSILSGYPYTSTLGIGGYYQFTPSTGNGALTSGASTTVLANPNLTWETAEQFDLGFDARFLNDRLTLGFDWYRKVTRDQLMKIKPLPEIGYSSSTVNSGKILNTGIDLEIGWRDHIGDFKYSVNGNLSTLKNEVQEVSSLVARYSETGISGFNNKLQPTYEKGHSIWYFRGFEYAGVDKETGKALYYDKDGQITTAPTDEDKKDLGCGIPKITYGITINLQYKGFDFTVFGSGAAGNKIYNLMVSADRPKINGIDTYWKDSWRQAGDDAKYPDMKQVSTDWTFFSSSAAVFNGSYFKFKQIQLGYTLPRKLTQKAFIDQLRLSVSLDDFFVITSYPGADPEYASLNGGASRGFDNGNYPNMKKVMFGVNISF